MSDNHDTTPEAAPAALSFSEVVRSKGKVTGGQKYTFLSGLYGGLGVTVTYYPVDLFWVHSEAPELFGVFLPESVKVRGPRSIKQAKQVLTPAEEGVRNTRAIIKVVEKGVPELLRDGIRIHATWEEIPRDEDGRPLEGHIFYEWLGADLLLLYYKILDASNGGKEVAASMASFLGGRIQDLESSQSGAGLRDDASADHGA
jgi:hypothetical protein